MLKGLIRFAGLMVESFVRFWLLEPVVFFKVYNAPI
jgi:hypothetical protein